jgi:capsular exopolysaccharide synthesis family protein
MMKYLKRIFERISPPIYVIKKPKSKDEIDGHIVAYSDRNSYVAEQYRVLRTSIYSFSMEKPVKTIAITSSQSGEGKTTTCCNLAITLSLDAEKKVLLIDSDLRKPELHRLLKISRKPGFSDVLINKIDIENFLKKPAIGNLYIIPSGNVIANAAELLRHTRLKEVIGGLKPRFDYIIFDTPPALNVTDSSVVGSMCDAVILVVKAEATQKNMIEETYNILKNAQAPPTGFILTNFRVPPYYAYKYKRYYKYK